MKKDYWKKRYEQMEQSANDQTVKYYYETERKFKRSMQEIEAKINAWYQRFAINNKISIDEARKLLNTDELAELKWNIEDYIRHGKENAVDQMWLKELENASAKFHINRLEALKLECQQSLEVATGGMVDDTDDLIRDAYKNTYYKSCFEIQKGVGVGFDVGKVNDKMLDKLLAKAWNVDEINFSTRLWTNKAKLINSVERELLNMVLTGAAPDKAIKNISKTMNQSHFAAMRVVQTEQAYFTTLAQIDSYKELDVEQFEVVATLDGITCDKCGSRDGKHFPSKIMQAGANAPPFHPLCRCTTAPYFDDMAGYRASRDENGKTTFEIPANMKYPEWKEKHLK